MATVIMDRKFAEELRRERAAWGGDRWDEVWEGTYMMSPLPNNEHQELVGVLTRILGFVVPFDQGSVFPGTNVSDREKGWEFNYRCPDVAVYLAGTKAKNCRTHWKGGPDFAVEIVSPDDMVRDKLPFYGQVAMRELLIIDRNPWALELLRLSGKKLKMAGASSLNQKRILRSNILPLTFRLAAAKARPTVEIVRTTDGQKWNV